jgi:hypothetical protein
MADEPAVNYSIKELFDKLEQKVDRIFDVLSSKADHADVAALNARLNAYDGRLTEHDGRLAELERVNQFEKESKTERSDYKRWFIPTVVGVLGLLLAGLGIVVTYLVST